MLKQLFYVLTGFVISLLILYFSQKYFVTQKQLQIRYDLFKVNIFFAVSSFIIVVNFIFLSKIESLKPQLGFIYLPTLFVKGIFFYLIFQNTVFSIKDLKMVERINLLIPAILFLIVEVLFIAKILNQKSN